MGVDFVFWLISVIHGHWISPQAFSSSPLPTPPLPYSFRLGAPKPHGRTLVAALCPKFVESNNCVQNINQPRPWQALRSWSLDHFYQAETPPCNLIFLLLKPACGRVIHSPSVFHPDVGCGCGGAPGSCCSQRAWLPNRSDGVWVRSLILKASCEERHFTVIIKAVSEREMSAVVVDQSLLQRKELVLMARLCTLPALNIYVRSNLNSAKC